MKKEIRTCMNCGYRNKNKCMLSGDDWQIERIMPTNCGRNFESWVKVEKLGLKNWVLKLWYGNN